MQGKTIYGYTLQRLLGVGGMAEVWLAENETGIKAAVKILLPKLCADDTIKSRFLTEAKVMEQLSHPYIRKVLDFGSIDERPAIIMEYLEGGDLKARMKSGQRFTDVELQKWWNQLVAALNYTHSQNIVHRDIKPSNIFIDQNGDVKLLDFGIAKVADTTSGTLTGSTLGTRIYMSPEQVKDPKRVGAMSDVYSLAVSFVHLLTGKTPYDSSTSSDYEIQESIVRKPLDISAVPEVWRNFLKPYLEKNPDDRPVLRPFDAALIPNKPQPVVDDESTVVESNPTSKPSPNPTLSSPLPQQPKSKKGLWIGLASMVVASVVALIIVLSPSKKNDVRQELSEVHQETTPVPEAVQPSPPKVDNNVFSVSPTKKVYFSKGNVQYQASSKTWRFAEHPWDCAGEDNVNISDTYGGWIDLFGWGTGNNPTNASKFKSDYGAFLDWGKNSFKNGGGVSGPWRTLRSEEWNYVFEERSTSSGLRYAKGSVNGVNGVILLPNNWNTSIYWLNDANKAGANYTSNSITASDWDNILQPNGAVFLPTTGGRLERKVSGVGISGGYWSSSSDGEKACYLYVRKDALNANGTCGRANGFSVRLVCNAE